jgi:hypothetical protein
MANERTTPLVIGWKEYVDFPVWGLQRIRAKVDTGARSSALDVRSYELWHDAERGPMVRLRLVLYRKKPDRVTIIEAPVLGTIAVRNSSGSSELRPLIEADIRLGPVCRRIRLTVTNRASMRFRMILGRHALAGDFVVDVSRKYLLGRRVSG